MAKSKPAARITVTGRRGKHAGGGAENAVMQLRAGRKGTGKVLAVVHYWPWSAKSVEAAEDYIYAAAEREGVEIIPALVD